MHMAIVVLSVLLTLLFGFTGTTEVFNTTTTARNNAAHLGISAGLLLVRESGAGTRAQIPGPPCSRRCDPWRR
jgi:hypothetical protein